MRFYRLLLRLYPASFRSEYGAEMCAAFAARRDRESGVLLWIGTLFSILSGAARAHADLLRQDLSWSFRTLLRSPSFAVTAIVVIAAGIGANTAAFTLLDHVLLRALPFTKPDRLVVLYQTEPANGYTTLATSAANLRDWQTMSRSFSAVGGYGQLSVNLSGEGDPRQIDGAELTSGVFRALDVHPVIGREFTKDDDVDGAPNVVLLSNGLATTLFPSAASAVGRTVNLDNQPYVVVGVMPEGFAFPSREAQLWTPYQFSPDQYTDPENRANIAVNVVARLRDDVSLEQARIDLSGVAAQLARTYPKQDGGIGVSVVKMQDDIAPQSRMLVIAVFGAGCCVLLIAWTNLANLLFARFTVRKREIAVRMAIGAGRERLLRQMFTENLVLAFFGGALGLWLASVLTPSLAHLVPDAMPVSGVPHIDLRIFAVAAALAIVTCVACGAGPALRASRTVDATALHARTGDTGRSGRLRTLLVLAEITCTVALLIGAGLLLRALWRVQSVDTGFHADHVLTMRTRLPMPKYGNQVQRTRFYSSVVAKTRALPGVTSAAYVSFLPMAFGGGIFPVSIPGSRSENTPPVQASIRYVTPDFFATMGIPVRKGRDIGDRDTPTAPFVAVISASLAQRLWPGQDPVGRQLNAVFFDRTVVGVVGDISVRRVERPSEPQIYLSAQQVPDNAMIFFSPKDLVVRVSGDTDALVPSIRRIIHDEDPEQSIADVQSLEKVVEAQTLPRRTQLNVLGLFAFLAFLLAAVGIYGLQSFAASARTQEVGVRLALGAKPRTILGMFLWQGLVLGILGAAIAIPIAYLAARTMDTLLFRVQPGDPLVYVCSALLAMLLTLAGSLGPALRASGVDPAITIRAD